MRQTNLFCQACLAIGAAAIWVVAACSSDADDCEATHTCPGSTSASSSSTSSGGGGGDGGGAGSGGGCASCKGACAKCEAGACAPLAKGEPGKPSCAPYLCDGKGTACPQSCAGEGSCAQGHFCSSEKTCVKKKTQGAPCGGENECEGGLCVDGYCCNNECTNTCRACDVPGKKGTCAEVPNGEPDPGTCEGPAQACDGEANCKLVLGQGCVGDGQCLSGSCVDGVCCENACDAPCFACNLSGKGTCTEVPKNTEDPSASVPCKLTKACDGAGNCKLKDGEPCQGGSDCLSGICFGNPSKCQSP
ncbi:MAG: hypothetical protein HY744_13545 [Deltaproteobacteria bacterium]|nr:hypothetical protein [Deltaproteobacteria bacterium]